MTFALAPTAIGYRLEAYPTIGSTNSVALERAREGDAGNLWIVSRRQDSGRGRRGRMWATPEGNLAATLLIVLRGRLSQAATLGFVAGLALSDALQAVAPGRKVAVGIDGGGSRGNRFELKWPNDVLADGAKLAGILLESTVLQEGEMAVAVGIGVNVVAHPEDTPYPATSLAQLGATVDAETLFLALSDAWVSKARIWNGSEGLEIIRQQWLQRAAGLGKEVAVRVDGEVSRGTFLTIDEECRFVIQQASGKTVKIAAGDVHFGAVASASAG